LGKIQMLSPEQILLNAIARTSTQFIYVVDVDAGKATYTNRSALGALGHESPSPLPVADLLGYLHPDDRALLASLPAEWASLGDHEVRDREHRLRHADGSYHWFLGRETVLERHEDGRVSKIVGTLLDITQTKRTEEALRERERFLRLSQEAGHCGSWEIDLSTGRKKWSGELSRIYGLDPSIEFEGAISERVNYIHPDDRDMVMRAMKRVVETKEPTDFEYRIVRDDGEERVIWARGRAVTDDAGHVVRMVGTGVDITERKQAEKALEDNETLTRGLVETSPIPMLVVSADKHAVLSMNRRFTEVFGYTVDEIPDIRAWWPKAYPDPTYRTDIEQLWSKAIVEATVANASSIAPVEAFITCRDGSLRFVEVHMGWFGDRALVLFNDLTERKRAEDTLERINEAITPWTGPHFFRSLANHLSDSCRVDYAFVAMIDESEPWLSRAIAVSHNGRLIDNFAYDLRDTPCHHVVGKSLCHYKTGVQVLFPQNTALVEMGIDSYMGIPLVSNTGRPLGLIVLLHSSPIPEPEQAEAILRVIATRAGAELERELAEKALRETEARHSAILESSLDGLIVFDAGGEIVEFNAAAETMFGHPRADAIGRDVADIIMPPALREEYQRSLARYVESRASGNSGPRIEMPALRSDGTEFRVELSIVPIGGSGPLLFAAVVRDVTNRLMLEEQLRQSQKLQAIGQLAGGVAHDFNNVLTVIMGYSEVLLANLNPGDPAREAAKHIHDAGERASLLTRQLLLFGRKAILETRPLDLNDVIQDTGAMLRRLIGEDVTFATILAASLSPVRIDRGQIEQIIVNLCLNSRDAMPCGGRINVETRAAAFDDAFCRLQPVYKPGRFVELAIGDTGTGMTDDVRAHLFEPFFTTKGPGKGTGLGLATVYGIVQQAGGFIVVESQLYAGTTIRVFLPAHETRELRQPEVGSEAPGRGRETVLLVEDEDGVRGLAALSLQKHGYTVLSASSGSEALALADGHPGAIDILVTDVVMAGMTGREVFERLREQRPALKVLFMSGYNDDEVVRRGVGEASSPFLQKPFALSTIPLKVRDVLGSF
jgi:two-component system, cell cycle sensor histidine kinase and response regulator CckA